MIGKTGFKIAALVAAASLLGACSATDDPSTSGTAEPGSDGRLVIGATFPILDEWLLTLADGLQEAADEHDIDLRIVAAQERVEVQLGQVENFISSEVDALIVIATDAEAAGSITEAASASNTPLVYVNRRPDNLPDDVAFVGSDSMVAGTLQMTELARLKGGEGNVAILQGLPGDYNTLWRTEGCKSVIEENPGMELVMEASGNFYRDQGQQITENWLQSGTDIDVICSNNDEMALGAILAIKAAGRELGPDGIVVGGVDATQDALGAVQAGDLAVTVFQDGPGQGAAAITAALTLIEGEPMEDNYFDVPFQLVTPENLDDFLG